MQPIVEDEPQFDLPSEELTSEMEYGPLNIPGKYLIIIYKFTEHELNEQSIWHLWFDEIMEHMQEKSNLYLENSYKSLIKHPGN